MRSRARCEYRGAQAQTDQHDKSANENQLARGTPFCPCELAECDVKSGTTKSSQVDDQEYNPDHDCQRKHSLWNWERHEAQQCEDSPGCYRREHGENRVRQSGIVRIEQP